MAILVVTVLMLPIGISDSPNSAVQLILGFAIGTLACIQIGAGGIANLLTVLLAAPLISGEIELQSWRLLRTTMMPLPEIVFAKLAAILNEQRIMLWGLYVLRFISTGTVVLFIVYGVMRQDLYYSDIQFRTFFISGKWLAYIILMTAIASYNLSQPLVQSVLCGMLGLAASAYTRTRSQAIAGGLVARLICWIGTTLLHIGLIYGIVYLFDNWSSPSYAHLEIFHNMPTPTSSQITWASYLMASGYLMGFLAAQVGFILFLAGIVLRRARRLEV
ncbi:MAG: hypothetical protein JXB30_16905 [Anaerolineae bacterium]|nr:hypothetical protein [Anaerolineae bacterium]